MLRFFWLALIIFVVALIVAKIRKEKAGMILAVVLGLSAYYVAVSVVMFFATFLGSIPWAPVSILLTALVVWLVGCGGVLFCASREGTASPWDRFYRGEGTSVGFKFGNVAIAIVIAIGAYGLNQTPGSQMPWLARDIIVLVSLVICLIIRAVDAQNYGTEEIGPRSSADGIAKVYHDLMINGVLLAVQAMTWVCFILVTIVNWILGEPTHWLLVVAIAVVWVIYLIIAIVKRGSLDYAKLHPEDPEWWND